MKPNLSSIMLWSLTALAAAGALPSLAQTATNEDLRNFNTFTVIPERNIFDPNRRPVYRGALRTNAPVYWFALTGTMKYEKGLFAFFAGTSSEYYKVLETGGKIATYTVHEITHDCVKLTSGTNELELKVGMQMLRNTDGSWSMAEQRSEPSSLAYDSGSRFRSSGRFDRGDRGDRNDRRFNSFGGRNNFRNGSQSYGFSRNESNFGGQTGGRPSDAAPAQTSGSSDPNDVIARMMAARAAQMGGSANQNIQGGNPNEPQIGNPNEPPGGNPNEPQMGNPNQPQGGNPPDNLRGNQGGDQNTPNANPNVNQTGNDN